MIERDQVIYIANLANLSLEEKETDLMVSQFRRILSYFEKLKEVDTKGVLPTYNPIDDPLRFREDKTAKSELFSGILENGPEVLDSFFVVPRVIE